MDVAGNPRDQFMNFVNTIWAKGLAVTALSTLAVISARADGTNAVRGGKIKPLARPDAVSGAVATNASPVVTPAPSTVTADPGLLGFEKLSGFKYEIPDDGKGSAGKDPDEQIPSTVKSYSGKQVAIKGFMLPLKVEGGKVTELLLMRDQSMCCYATVPKINEWISVKMTGGGVKAIMDQPITLHGTLKIGAVRENGYIVCIYQMDGDKMDGPSSAL